MTPDHINAAFEAGGAIFLCLNVARIRRDRTVRGVSLWPTAWWSLWGVWNVYYYQALTQPASFWAGVAVVVVNTVWLAHALWYAHEERRRRSGPMLATGSALDALAELHALRRARRDWPHGEWETDASLRDRIIRSRACEGTRPVFKDWRAS